MSGIEIVGVVLGASPLLISAMEHYEDTRRVSTIWWRIRRAHKRDLGNLKDCHLAFRTHLKELLLPLLIEGVTDEISYDDLLANPGGPGWRKENVNEALAARLTEHHERYFEIMADMTEAMAKLSTDCKVDDKSFQLGLAGRESQHRLSLEANIKFESKRAAYAITRSRRDILLTEVERYIGKLKEILVANDRVNAISGRRADQQSNSTVPKAFLEFWRHAESIFRVVKKAWQCQCTSRSQTILKLEHRKIPEVDMTMLMRFCHGPTCIQVRLLKDPSRSCLGPGKKLRTLAALGQNETHPRTTMQMHGAPTGSAGPGGSPATTVSK